MALFTNMSASADIGYTSLSSVTDVGTIIDQLKTDLVTGRGMTQNAYSAGTSLDVTSISLNGKFWRAVFTKIDADTMSLSVKDQDAVDIIAVASARRMDIEAAGGTIRIHSTKYQCFIISQRATIEATFVGILDGTGGQGISGNSLIYANASRNSAGTLTGFSAMTTLACRRSDGSTGTDSVGRWSQPSGVTSVINNINAAGTRIFYPIPIFGNLSGGAIDKLLGYMRDVYAAPLTITDNFLQGQTGVSAFLPIGDAGETGAFRISHFGTPAPGFYNWCYRVS